ncbi:alpha/beta-hydrolase [Rhizodiscina lignyota]|uniref:Alpha/beta-hydrolase n=1 Tax=Rhizodiscina lignyota TaxID=1504668 RepID=A0A9P4IJ37_9PEZI|nr:alpha/beta-hydrolase [Rhizodiscina lignyota]
MSIRHFFQWFQPTIDALTAPNIPFDLRWRLLLLQPISLLTFLLKHTPWALSHAYTVHWIPTRDGRSLRVIVFQPSRTNETGLRPLHVSIHGGAFLGGIAEYNADFASIVAQRTGAVVVCPQYRCAPAHPFPAAIDDIDDLMKWLVRNAEQKFHANPKIMTMSGHSAGGNLVLAACQQEEFHGQSDTAVKAAVTFYAAIDLRLEPRNKPKPPNFPKKDPLSFLMPLFNAYARLAPPGHGNDPRLHPVIAELETLPRNLLLIIGEIDILLHEQLTFVQRLKGEIEEAERAGGARGEAVRGRKVESVLYEKGFHGWLEC